MTTETHIDHDPDVNKRHCEWCGKFLVGARSDQKYCDRACRAKHWRRENLPPIVREVYERTCPVCGTEFTSIQESAKYDSRACGQKAHRMRRKGIDV